MPRSNSVNCPERLPLRDDVSPERRRKSRLDSLRSLGNLNSEWKICICVLIFVTAILAVLVTGLVYITKSVFNIPPLPPKFIHQECTDAMEFCRNCRRNNESCMSRELDNDISNEVIFQSLDRLCDECHEQYADCPKIQEKCEPHHMPDHFCYTDVHCGPKTWGGICSTGSFQSPIVLPNVTKFFFKRSISRKTSLLQFNQEYKQIHSEFLIKNNDHTIQVQLTRNLTSSAQISGETLTGSYTFSQLHFHWGSKHGFGSEHGIDGKFYDLEIHLVHYSDHYASLQSALLSRDRRALAVLAIFVQVSSNSNSEPNPNLDPIFKAIELLNDSSQNEKLFEYKAKINLFSLLPDQLDFYRYQGSLTSPPCVEVVSWVIFRQPVVISQEQFDTLRGIQDRHHYPLSDNYRFPQPTGHREVIFQRFVP